MKLDGNKKYGPLFFLYFSASFLYDFTSGFCNKSILGFPVIIILFAFLGYFSFINFAYDFPQVNISSANSKVSLQILWVIYLS